MKKRLLTTAIVLITIIIAPIVYNFVIYPLSLYLSPKRAIKIFYTRVCAEDQKTYPLMIAGKKIIPYLISEVKNKKMHNRRYAIYALGQIGDKKAIPFLKTILNDETEIYYFRYDALHSIAMLDIEAAKESAKKFVDKKIEMVSELSQQLLTDERSFQLGIMKKTIWDAILDQHE